MNQNYQLRPFESSDAPVFAQHANNFHVARFLADGFPHPYTLENAEAFIAKVMQDSPSTVFAITVNGEAVGGIGLHAKEGIERKNMELGYWLAQPFWGQGIVTAAVQEMVAYGFKTFDIARIYARPFGANIGSQRVLEKAGFVLEAHFEKTLYKNGEFQDDLVYAVRATQTL
jgi:[ribosomal protein S5]-alanine N-acetyltransferase